MATIVCQQGLDSQIVEPRTLRMKLSSNLPHLSPPLEILALKSCFSDSKREDFVNKKEHHARESQATKSSDTACGGWSFLQALSNGSSQGPKVEREDTYVHPLVKRSSSKLNEASLRLCTENLGNETGTDIADSGIFPNSYESEEKSRLPAMERQTKRQIEAKPRDFPPPLTTISGSESLQVRPHREDGRLVIKAVKAPLRRSYFQAERSNGRLRLCLLRNCPSNLDSEMESVEKEEENEEEEEEEQEQGVGEEEEEEDLSLSEEMDEKKLENGGEIGIKKFERPSRGRTCKESGEHENKTLILLNWVASS
ncbi:hypothetical protein UlMin_009335 [Ulmus minor]